MQARTCPAAAAPPPTSEVLSLCLSVSLSLCLSLSLSLSLSLQKLCLPSQYWTVLQCRASSSSAFLPQKGETFLPRKGETFLPEKKHPMNGGERVWLGQNAIQSCLRCTHHMICVNARRGFHPQGAGFLWCLLSACLLFIIDALDNYPRFIERVEGVPRQAYASTTLLVNLRPPGAYSY